MQSKTDEQLVAEAKNGSAAAQDIPGRFEPDVYPVAAEADDDPF